MMLVLLLNVIFISNTVKSQNLTSNQSNDKFLEINLNAQDTSYSGDQESRLNYFQSAPILKRFLNHKEKYGLKFDAGYLDRRASNKNHDHVVHINSKLDFNGVQFPTKKLKKSINSTKFKRKKIIKKTKNKNIDLQTSDTKRFKKITLFLPLNSLSKTKNKLVRGTTRRSLNKTQMVSIWKNHKKVLKALEKNILQSSRDNDTEDSRQAMTPRWLDIYDLVEFETHPFCTTSPRPLRSMTGSCYSENKCARLDGLAMDQCTLGYGVCCICKINLVP